ncbi:MAG: lipase [Colwellia sp.]
MKKLVISLTIISALGLSGCDSETIEDVKKEVAENGTPVVASARVKFDPANGGLSVPNDLLFSGTPDGTLNMPVARDEDGNYLSGEYENGSELIAPNYADPSTAIGALDGWSTTNPFLLEIIFPTGTSLDANSAMNPASVQIFETLMGGAPGCEEVPRGAACSVVSELTFDIDFVTQASGKNVAVIPLKPLKAKTSYIVALTNNLKDSNGKAVAGSTTYESVRLDIATHPLATPAQLGLQGVINSYENAIVAAGADKDALIYTMALTTQSTVDVLTTMKGLLAAPLAQGGLPPIVAINTSAVTVSQVLFPSGAPTPQLDALYSSANYHTGSVTLPYYLGVPSIENPKAPVNDWWKSLCDSGAIIAGFTAAGGTLPEGPLTPVDGVCMAVGLRDVSSVIPLDVKRHLTKYSPVPAPRGASDIPWITDPSVLDVQMTTPNISATTDAVRAGFGLPPLVEMPSESGWPVIILQHGITSKKEHMLAVTGILSAFGFATVAIDHPLHGSRGFDLDPTMPGDEINASTVSATHYMNLASLLTTRDNLRQSTADILGLRLGLNAVVIGDGSGDKIDGMNVHFLGHSLGAITGINFLSLTNATLGNETLDAMFAVKTNSLAMPGVMVANFLMESGAFGNVIKSSLTYAQSPTFKATVDGLYPLDENGNSTATQTQLVAVYQAAYAAMTPTEQAELNGVFAQFTFAAQTVVDSGDPANYASMMALSNKPTHLIEVVGDGGSNLPDQVIPNSVSTTPLGGTKGAITLLDLPGVSSSTQGESVSGAVRFLFGHHSSILRPNAEENVAPTLNESAVTTEMQGQVAGFFLSSGQSIVVTNPDVIQ